MRSNGYFINGVLRKYLFPTILAILGTTVVSFINGMLVGKMLGRDALTAVNIVSSFTFLFSMLGCLINIGASSEASVAIGREDYKRVGACTTYALIASIVTPVLAAIPCVVFFEEFMELMGADEAMYLISLDYARIMLIFGFLTTLMYFPFNFLRLDGRASHAVALFGSMAAMDVAFVLLFLRMGLGLPGVGLAIVLSTAVVDIIGIFCLLSRKGSVIRLGVIRFGDIAELSRNVWARGSAAGLNNLCNMLRTMILNAWILRYLGADGAGEFAVACSIMNLTAASVSGSGQTIAPLAGIFYGEKDTESLRMVVKNAVRYALWIHMALCVIAIPAARHIAGAFGMVTEPVASETALAIIAVFISLIPAAALNVYIYYYMTLKKVVLSCALMLSRSFVFMVLFAGVLLVSGHGEFFYVAFPMAELTTILIMLLLGFVDRIHNPKRIGMLLYINEMPEGSYISFSVESNTAGAVEASAKMAEFCDEHKLEQKIKMFLPMALEELLITVNEYCLKNRFDEYIDVRIYLDAEGLLLRIRCNGLKFDPVAWYRKKSEEMSVEEMLMDDALGMKMIVEQAKSVTYQNTFGMNNLVVIL